MNRKSLGKSLSVVAAKHLLKIGRWSAAAFSAKKTAAPPLFAGDGEKQWRCRYTATKKVGALVALLVNSASMPITANG